MVTESINQKPGIFKQGVRYNYNPIFEMFLGRLKEAGFGVTPATVDEIGGRTIHDDSIHLSENQIILAHFGDGPVMSKVVRTWCGMAILDHEIYTEGAEWDSIQSIWAGV